MQCCDFALIEFTKAQQGVRYVGAPIRNTLVSPHLWGKTLPYYPVLNRTSMEFAFEQCLPPRYTINPSFPSQAAADPIQKLAHMMGSGQLEDDVVCFARYTIIKGRKYRPTDGDTAAA